MKTKQFIIAIFLPFVLMAISGCGSAVTEGKDTRKTEFRITSVPSGCFVSEADTSISDRNEINDRLCENWHRDLILGHGSLHCVEPPK